MQIIKTRIFINQYPNTFGPSRDSWDLSCIEAHWRAASTSAFSMGFATCPGPEDTTFGSFREGQGCPFLGEFTMSMLRGTCARELELSPACNRLCVRSWACSWYCKPKWLKYQYRIVFLSQKYLWKCLPGFLVLRPFASIAFGTGFLLRHLILVPIIKKPYYLP